MRIFKSVSHEPFTGLGEGNTTVSYSFTIEEGEVKVYYKDVEVGHTILKSYPDDKGRKDGRLVITHFYNHAIPGELNYKDVFGPGKQAKGVGTIMLHFVVKMAKKMGDTTVYVDEPTQQSLGGYRHFGFQTTGSGMKMSVPLDTLAAKVGAPQLRIVDHVPLKK